MANADDALRDRLLAGIAPVAASHGLLCEQVDLARLGRRRLVRVVLDLPDGPGAVGSDELAEASRGISAALDAADVIDEEYVLEVSTPGVDRPLTEPRHFRRAQGRLVRLRRADGGPDHGRILAADEVGIRLQVDGGAVLEVPFAVIAKGIVEVELHRIEED